VNTMATNAIVQDDDRMCCCLQYAGDNPKCTVHNSEPDYLERNRTCSFTCSDDFKVGAYQLIKGDKLKVVSDGDGLFSVYVQWAEGVLSRLNINDINKLAGFDVTRRAHWVGGGK
jgi:hypothetical protein